MQCRALEKTVCGKRGPHPGPKGRLAPRSRPLTGSNLAPAVRVTFEGGQLRLAAARELLAALKLPGARWDAARAAYLVPGFRYRELLLALKARGVACDDRVRRALPGPLLVRDPKLSGVLGAALAAWSLAGRRGSLVLPRPEDRLQLAIAALALLRCPALILLPRLASLERWTAAIRQVCREPLVAVRDSQDMVRPRPITVITHAAAGRQLGRLGHRFPLVVVDEAESWTSSQSSEALELCTAEARLGLAGLFPADPGARAQLAARLGPVVSCCPDSAGSASGALCSRVQLHLTLSAEERLAHQRARARAQPGEGARITDGAGAKLERVGRLLAHHGQQRLLLVAREDETARVLSRRYLLPAITGTLSRQRRERLLRRLGPSRQSYIVTVEVLELVRALPVAEVGVLLGRLPPHCLRWLIHQLERQAGRPPTVYELLAQGTWEEAAAAPLASVARPLRAGDLRCLMLWA